MRDVLDYIDELDYINAASVLITTSLTFTIGLLWRDTCKHGLKSYVIHDEDSTEKDHQKNIKMFKFSIKSNLIATIAVLVIVSFIHKCSQVLSSKVPKK